MGSAGASAPEPGIPLRELTSPQGPAEGVPPVDPAHSEKPEAAGRTSRVWWGGWGGARPAQALQVIL